MLRYLLGAFFALVCCLTNSSEAADAAKKTVCLNMIVKDETPVIRRCLASVKPIIDYWVIVDTGSKDGTQDMIREFMKDVPGELYERPWKNFAHNRNQALEFAKGKADYILIIDADEVLAYDDGFKLPHLESDCYFIVTDYSGMKYNRVQLINNSLDWTWKGVLHETLDAPVIKTRGTVTGVRNVVRTDGARSQDPRKFYKDAEVLEAALVEEPNNSRYVFYLAQSYRDAGEHRLAMENYERRVKMGGWDQEIYWSMLQIARMKEALQLPHDEIVDSFYKAYWYKPDRIEPLYNLANYYRHKGDYMSAYLIAYRNFMNPIPDDILFVEKWIYDYGLLMEFSIAAYWVGEYVEAQLASHLLLTKADIPTSIRDCVEKNLGFIQKKLNPLRAQTYISAGQQQQAH